MKVSLIIVNYNGAHLLTPCLASVLSGTRIPDEIIVVDNGSSDDSLRLVAHQFPTVHTIGLNYNAGFAAANNVGIRESTGDILILLNNDTRSYPDFIEQIIQPFEEGHSLGSTAATMVFATAPDVIASQGIAIYDTGLALDAHIGEPVNPHDAVQPVFGPSGGAAAYRRTALDEVGLLEETFFMYLEDADLAWRLQLAGWNSVAVPGAITEHHYSASSIEGSSFKRYLLARNRAWLLRRCVPDPLWDLLRWRIYRYEFLAAGYSVLKGDWAAIRGRIDGWRYRHDIGDERSQIQQYFTGDISRLIYWVRPSPPVQELMRLRQYTARMAQ